jgi:hypothetical protein
MLLGLTSKTDQNGAKHQADLKGKGVLLGNQLGNQA